MTRYKHGMAGTAEYQTWCNMMRRCTKSGDASYKDYGGRGIKVCLRWTKFTSFYRDMGPRPSGLSLDRIDNDGNYEPGNCRWATHQEQSRNTRFNVYLTHRGETKLLIEWCEEADMPFNVVYNRINFYGWDPEDALSLPVLSRGQRYHYRKLVAA